MSYSCNANLSQWAGKDVRIALVPAAPSSGGNALRGRWVQARLMGVTFNIVIGSN